MDERHRQLSEALRLTVEYVGIKTLHPVEGWSWFDALRTEPWFDDWLVAMTAHTFDNQETAVMDERRDLVDREELRRQFEVERDSLLTAAQRHPMNVSLGLLDAMPAVECPRGWTRDEVLKELDADPDAACDNDLLYEAWGLIANSSGGNWEEADRLAPGWKAAAERWRDAWHRTLPGRVAPEPEWVPLTEVPGRRLDSRPDAIVYEVRAVRCGESLRLDFLAPSGELLGTQYVDPSNAVVAVRPKAAT